MTTAITPINPRAMDMSGIPEVFTHAQRTILTQRTPPEEIRERQGKGGMKFKYIAHSYVTELLNNAFQWDWDFIIVSHQILEDEVIVECALTVRTPNGQTITKQQFGGSDIKRDRNGKLLSIADDLKAAASDGLKKAGSLLGIGLDLYGREHYGEDTTTAPTRSLPEIMEAQEYVPPPTRGFTQQQERPQAPAQNSTPYSGQAIRNPGEPASEKQVKAIFGMARGERDMSPEEIKSVAYGMCGIEHMEELTKAQASQLIEWIKSGDPIPASVTGNGAKQGPHTSDDPIFDNDDDGNGTGGEKQQKPHPVMQVAPVPAGKKLTAGERYERAILALDLTDEQINQRAMTAVGKRMDGPVPLTNDEKKAVLSFLEAEVERVNSSSNGDGPQRVTIGNTDERW